MKNRFAAIYSIATGTAVIILWSVILRGGRPPEGGTELVLHLSSEFLMATFCIVSGILLLRRRHPGRMMNLAALGMVAYSVLNAAGYYGEGGSTTAMILFLFLFAATVAVMIIQMLPEEKQKT